MLRIILYVSSLVLVLFSSETQGQVCGWDLGNIWVKPFSIDLLDSLDGDWFLLGFLDSENIIYNDTQCIHYHYDSNQNDNSINVIKHQRYCNQTRVQIEQKINIINRNKNFITYNSNINDSNGIIYNFRIINFDICDNNTDNHFLIYYSCAENADGTKRTIFMLLTREFAQGPNSNVLYEEIRSLMDIREYDNFRGNLKVFGDVCGCKEEDPIWTTTQTPTTIPP